VRLLVGLDADAVAGAVDEPVAQAGTGDDAPRRRVHLLTGYADTRRPYRLLLRVDQHGVRVAHLRRRLAHDEQARDVRAVVVHAAAEVTHDDVAGLDHASARLVVGPVALATRPHPHTLPPLTTYHH